MVILAWIFIVEKILHLGQQLVNKNILRIKANKGQRIMDKQEVIMLTQNIYTLYIYT